MKKFTEESTIDDVTAAGMDIYNALVDGSIQFAVAKEMTNALGKTINSVKVQLEYAALRKDKPDIAFLNVPKKPSPKKS